MTRRASVLICLAAIALALSSNSLARGEAIYDKEAGLTCSQVLQLGVEGYIKRYERRRGGLSSPDEQVLRQGYTVCRRERNAVLARRLPRVLQQRLSQFQRALEGWEASYLTCCWTDSHSASIGGHLASWSEPLREDLIGEIITDLNRPTESTKPSEELTAALARAERMVSRWEGVALRWERESQDAGRRAGVKEIRAEAPRLRKQLRALNRISVSLPVRARTRLARHMTVYMNRLDNWERG